MGKPERNSHDVPDVVVQRLPRYFNALRRLSADEARTISSDQLAKLAGVTPGQVRRDLSYFGGFGRQGKGYDTAHLLQNLSEILNLNHEWRTCLVGMGLLGQAIARHRVLQEEGFRIVALFDKDPAVIGHKVGDLVVTDSALLKEECARVGAQIAIIAVPAERAQVVVDELVRAGVRGILNYTTVPVVVPEGVLVRNLDPLVGLQSMTYYLESQPSGFYEPDGDGDPSAGKP